MADLMIKLDSVDGERTMNVKAFGGTHIARACEQATKIATMLAIVVHFDFNGIACYARPNSDWRTLERNWEKLLGDEKRPRYAGAWSDIPAVSEG